MPDLERGSSTDSGKFLLLRLSFPCAVVGVSLGNQCQLLAQSRPPQADTLTLCRVKESVEGWNDGR